jgi:iron complex transport system ATP-binding protein
VEHISSAPNLESVLSARTIDVRHGAAGGSASSDALVLNGVSATFAPGELVAIVGPNGSGKSSFVSALSRTLAPESGAVLLDQADLYTAVSARESARLIGVVPQSTDVFLDFTVRDIVAMGRAPWRSERGLLAEDTDLDRSAVEAALARMEIDGSLADRSISRVSGGERQRALVARMLAQEARILLLDEPTAALDLAAQSRLLLWLRELATRERRAVVAVLHDINLAAQFADRIVVLKQGRVFADGSPNDVITSETIQTVYGVSAWVTRSPIDERPVIASLASALHGAATPAFGGDRVHLFCGCGTAVRTMFRLTALGASVSASFLVRTDLDHDAAQFLGLPCSPVDPFSIPTSDEIEAAAALSAGADAAILTRTPIGELNSALVDQAVGFARSGRPLIVVKAGLGRAAIEERIRLSAPAVFVNTDDDAVAALRDLLSLPTREN